ncbi:hypothetical protein PVAND_015527 [Polypedilum vanderplanki]|uniref:Uncharacterized protein n=1 Tax=Polypedilum vanderplanki TaxID=319348 RepID=A0A9J6BCH8_POLVA|nr:hypothetical protein PVAND_015527 [Polypedilum vanderplanki]
MNLRFGLFLFTIVIFILSSKSFELRCTYNMANYYIGTFYECKDLDYKIKTQKDAALTSVSGKHSRQLTNEKVNAIWFAGYPMNFFPSNLTNFYPYIKAIWISYSNLSSLCSYDMEKLTQLKLLYIHSGKIAHLSSDLFANNKELEYIGIRANPIHHIDFGTFSNLKNLHTLFFVDNSCFSGNVYYNKNLIDDIVKKVENKCQNKEFKSECEEKSEKLLVKYPMMNFHSDGKF